MSAGLLLAGLFGMALPADPALARVNLIAVVGPLLALLQGESSGSLRAKVIFEACMLVIFVTTSAFVFAMPWLMRILSRSIIFLWLFQVLASSVACFCIIRAYKYPDAFFGGLGICVLSFVMQSIGITILPRFTPRTDESHSRY
jgi:hypothetical protein